MLRRPLLIVLFVLACFAPAARAGTYDVYSCYAGSDSFRNPSANAGAWAKTSDPNDQYGAFDQCGSSENGLGVIAKGGYQAPNGRFGEVSFTAPEGTRVEHLRLWRTAWSYGSGSGASVQRNYLFLLADGMAGRGEAFDGSDDVPLGAAGSTDTANHGLIPANQLDVDLTSVTPQVVSYRVGCRFESGCPTADSQGGFASGVKIYGAQVTLRDSSEPTLAVAPAGLLAPGAGPHRGKEMVRVTAARDNVGIKRLAVYADAGTSPVGVADFERNPDRCAWWHANPCQDVSDVDIEVDTKRVADGEHRFVVRAYDAAENVHSFTSDPVTVKNGADAKPDSLGTAVPVGLRGPLNGAGASDHAVLTALFARSRRATLTTRFGRSVAVGGRLLDEAGHAIVGAEVAIATRGGGEPLGVARTGADGRFRFVVPGGGPSRRLVIGYRSHLADPAPAAARELTLRVTAGVGLGVHPRHVRNGQSITFAGSLLGRPIPRAGKLVDMQVRVGRRWQTFATARARGSRGLFHYRYRFTRSPTRITYFFRALAREEGGYAYATGASRTVSVRVN